MKHPRRRVVSEWTSVRNDEGQSIDFETGELYVDQRIQRAGRQILHRETKTEESDDFLPLPEFCLKALRMRRAQQTGDRRADGKLWQDTRGLIFTTKYGTPIEPANLTRMFALRARRAGPRGICRQAARPHNARGPGSLRGLSLVCTRQDSNLQPSDP